MKTVESRTMVRHLANSKSGITICGLLRHGSWTAVAPDSEAFFRSPAMVRCERCERKAVRRLDKIERVA